MVTVGDLSSFGRRPNVRGWRLCCPNCAGRDIKWRGEELVCAGCDSRFENSEPLARAERDDSAGRYG